MPSSWVADISTTIVSPPHDSGTSSCSASWREHALRVGVVLVDLVDGHDDRHLGRLGVVDRLDRLGHHAVVGGDDEHDDVRGVGAAGAHLGERGVARRVEERDPPAVLLDLVGADVLGDATGLAGDDVGVADLVEHGRLAVVDVAHDRDDRRPRLEVGLVVAVVEQRLEADLLLLAGLDEHDVGADLEGEQLHLLVREVHRRRDHLAVVEQEADDVGRRAVQLRAELLGRHAALDDDGALGHRRVAARVVRELRLQLLAVATTTPAATTARWAPLTGRATAGTARTTRTATGARAAGTTGTATGARTAGATAGAAGPPNPPGRGPPGPPERGPPGPPDGRGPDGRALPGGGGIGRPDGDSGRPGAAGSAGPDGDIGRDRRRAGRHRGRARRLAGDRGVGASRRDLDRTVLAGHRRPDEITPPLGRGDGGSRRRGGRGRRGGRWALDALARAAARSGAER